MGINKIVKFFFLILALILMCFFKIWWTSLLFIGLGFAMTIIFRKKNFCSYVCPVGSMQDFFAEKENKFVSIKRLTFLYFIVHIVFYGFIFVSFFLFYYFEKNKDFYMWRLYLFMFFSVIMIALFLQNYFGKRFWCRTYCPVSSLYSLILKLYRINYRIKKQNYLNK